MSDSTRMAEASAALIGEFRGREVSLAAACVKAKTLRMERFDLMNEWTQLILANNFEDIAIRATRIAEIDRELARIGQ